VFWGQDHKQRNRLCQHLIQDFRRERVHFSAAARGNVDYARLIAAHYSGDPNAGDWNCVAYAAGIFSAGGAA
jgi:hypothetical protein